MVKFNRSGVKNKVARAGNGDRHLASRSSPQDLSRCFLQSTDENKLGCISCHDPHRRVPAAERTTFYRSRCLKCHQNDREQAGRQPGCALPPAKRRLKTKQDSCVACHMPRYQSSDIAHAASTDHRILRVHGGGPQGSTPAVPHQVPLVPFFHAAPADDKHGADTGQSPRDLGIALADLVMKAKAGLRESELALKGSETKILKSQIHKTSGEKRKLCK